MYDAFLQTLGIVKMNSLNMILDSNQFENDDNEYMQLMRHSLYYDKEIFGNLIHSPQKCFSILSSNIHGIRAKFYELKISVEDIREKYNFEFSTMSPYQNLYFFNMGSPSC